MAGGTPYTEFTDFMQNTPPTFLSGPEEMVNEVQRRSYILKRFLKGKGMDRVLQGGESIKDTLLTTDPGTYTEYHPNETFTWENPQVTTQLSINWRFAFDKVTWTEQEIELQVPEGAGDAHRDGVYKRVKRIKQQAMWTSMMGGMEDAEWFAPANQQSAMEAAAGKKPYSIPVFINEQDATSAGANSPGDGLFTGWTTVMGINPTTDTYWRCQRAQYDHTDPDDTDGDGDGLFDRFDLMYHLLWWEAPGVHEEFFEEMGFSSKFVATNRRGRTLMMKLLRESNDLLLGNRQDPAYMNPKYAGFDILYIAKLDTAALYPGAGGTFVAEDTATAPGPRFYCIDGEYLTPIWHRRKYMSAGDVKDHPNQVSTKTQLYDSWWNNFCNSRQRHGIIYPGA